MKYLKLVIKIVVGIYCAFAVFLSVEWWISDEPFFFNVNWIEDFDEINKRCEENNNHERGLQSRSIVNRKNYKQDNGFFGSYSAENNDILLRKIIDYDVILEHHPVEDGGENDLGVVITPFYIFNYGGVNVFFQSRPENTFVSVPSNSVSLLKVQKVRYQDIVNFEQNDFYTPSAYCDIVINDTVGFSGVRMSPLATLEYMKHKEDKMVDGLVYIEVFDEYAYLSRQEVEELLNAKADENGMINVSISVIEARQHTTADRIGMLFNKTDEARSKCKSIKRGVFLMRH